MFNKIMAAVIGVFGLTVIPVVSVSQATPIIFNGLTMDVHRTNNVRVGTGDDATSLLARFNSGAAVCTVALTEFTNVGGLQDCGTGKHDTLATLYTLDYSLGSGTANFQLGADWGLGGIIIGADGGNIVRIDDVWWRRNWNNSDVINFSVSGSGHGRLQLLGFEHCCSGDNSLRVSVDSQTYSAVRASAGASVSAAVPEPAPFALLGLGLLGLGVMRRRSVKSGDF